MSTTLPSPPATPPQDASSNIEDLVEKLDNLLESYLNLLDTYTTLRAQLSTHFSSGFFSLAHANRNAASVLGAGRRFGEEGYDGRMKAGRGVSIEKGRLSRGSKIEEESSKPNTKEEGEDVDDEEHEQYQNGESTTLTTIDLNPSSKDPLKWFTPFPPPALRQTQSHFTSAVTLSIPELLSTMSQMSAIEERIWDVRAELGIMDEYERSTEATVRPGSEKDEAVAEKREKPSSTTEKAKAEVSLKASESVSLPSPSKRHSFVSRSKATEPRSRVLKLD